MSPFKGVLHKYSKTHVAFELSPSGNKHVLVMIGGMTDGLLTVPYTVNLAKALAPLNFSVIQPQLTSSFKGFGISSLDRDIQELKELTKYLKSEEGGSREKIIIMGHSTGAQDVMHYLLHNPKHIDAGILQGSCSDREGLYETFDKDMLEKLNKKAIDMVQNGQKNDLLPSEYSKLMINTPLTAYRWCSLVLKGGDDDYFSSDLPIETLKNSFGKVNKPFLIAYSEEDEFVPESVNKLNLLKKWESISDSKYWSKNSGLVRGASHFVEKPDSQAHLFEMVIGFITEFSLNK
ncbi:hypothetical protein TBLA_0B03910 [Henningerozyma blattae CBS 6284]|uniref:Uncharacterized protein n=1 Tax=Henningerozyma blattae (strain ATCC 34711 / CBS 6284 / DSM 70876 / NBRC 10599 / NRRL Y-10934 / UCD 77-7) TaxID=1071380 RepID=I2GYM7_HENB6|nr:hypothetical protein TBLA_0B03910 [Tetrapisispora blattae CBS 6284]CCH59229.1 hypothetical protein TBLA_0B03910 [Tetrapisispora blattae CBS 6284]